MAISNTSSECEWSESSNLGSEHLGQEKLPETIQVSAEEEDVIRCICNIYRDEGLMIQCEMCEVGN